jgi:hypothetical protein
MTLKWGVRLRVLGAAGDDAAALRTLDTHARASGIGIKVRGDAQRKVDSPADPGQTARDSNFPTVTCMTGNPSAESLCGLDRSSQCHLASKLSGELELFGHQVWKRSM